MVCWNRAPKEIFLVSYIYIDEGLGGAILFLNKTLFVGNNIHVNSGMYVK